MSRVISCFNSHPFISSCLATYGVGFMVYTSYNLHRNISDYGLNKRKNFGEVFVDIVMFPWFASYCLFIIPLKGLVWPVMLLRNSIRK